MKASELPVLWLTERAASLREVAARMEGAYHAGELADGCRAAAAAYREAAALLERRADDWRRSRRSRRSPPAEPPPSASGLRRRQKGTGRG